MHNSPELPPNWQWMLAIERRLIRLECRVRQLGAKTTAPKDDGRRWNPRDLMMASAGVVMVLAAIANKIGWTTLAASLVKLYGSE